MVFVACSVLGAFAKNLDGGLRLSPMYVRRGYIGCNWLMRQSKRNSKLAPNKMRNVSVNFDASRLLQC